MLAIPNTTMVNTTVASYTNFPHLRLDVEVTLAVTEDINTTSNVGAIHAMASTSTPRPVSNSCTGSLYVLASGTTTWICAT